MYFIANCSIGRTIIGSIPGDDLLYSGVMKPRLCVQYYIWFCNNVLLSNRFEAWYIRRIRFYQQLNSINHTLFYCEHIWWYEQSYIVLFRKLSFCRIMLYDVKLYGFLTKLEGKKFISRQYLFKLTQWNHGSPKTV